MGQGRMKRTVWVILLALATGACGGSGTDVEPPEYDPAVEPFVGRWEADSLTITSVADTSIVANLLEVGGGFTLVVDSTGLYTATLRFAAADSLGIQPFVEIGQLTVADGFVTLRPQTPPGSPASSEYEFLNPDLLQLEGPTDFDFNQDETPDPAILYVELLRQ